VAINETRFKLLKFSFSSKKKNRRDDIPKDINIKKREINGYKPLKLKKIFKKYIRSKPKPILKVNKLIHFILSLLILSPFIFEISFL